MPATYNKYSYQDKVTVIDAIIAAITNESPYYPLPDAEIARILAETGLAITGPSVGYYRKTLGIKGAPQRRKSIAEVKGE